MIGILVITHGNLGEELIKSAVFIVKESEKVSSMALPVEEDRVILKKKLLEKIDSFDTSDGILVFVDMPGTSSCNLAMEIMNERKVKILTGVNLPMILTALTKRTQMSLDEITEKIIEAGRKSITKCVTETI